jgi:predicted Zn-dependent protease
MIKQEQFEYLMEAGFAAINNSETEKAINIGKKLKKMRHTSAFEILALAYLNDDKTKKAIKILKKGVDIAPDLWILWQLLGNTYSDINKFNHAQRCYQKAIECDENDRNSILYNSALAYARNGDNDQYEKQISRISLQELHERNRFDLLLHVVSENISIFLKKGFHSKARKLAEQYINIDIVKSEYYSEYSNLLALYAESLWRLNETHTAVKYLHEAVMLDKLNSKAIWLFRELDNISSETAKYFNILVRGEWPEPFEGESIKPGFFTSYKVVAENLNHALDFIKKFESPETYNSIKVEESEILDANPKVLLGVYETTGYSLFPGEEITN